MLAFTGLLLPGLLLAAHRRTCRPSPAAHTTQVVRKVVVRKVVTSAPSWCARPRPQAPARYARPRRR